MLNQGQLPPAGGSIGPAAAQNILDSAARLRWEVGGNFHENLVEAIYTDAARIADRAVAYPEKPPRFNLDRTIDRLVTSRIWGFPLMFLLFTLVFWITISGANYPSAMHRRSADRYHLSGA